MGTATRAVDDDFAPLSDEDADELERRWEQNRRAAGRGGRPSSRSADNRPPRDASTGSASTRRPSTPNTSSGSMLKFSTDDGAGFVLGLIGFALGSAWFRFGWPGVTGWLSAKFLNRVTLGATATPPTSTGGVVNGTHQSAPLPPAQKPDPTPVGAGPPPTITSPARPGNRP